MRLPACLPACPLACLVTTIDSAAAVPHEQNKGAAGVTWVGNANDAKPTNGGDISQAATPLAAPREYVVGLYNSYAETFDSHLQGALEYRTPTVIMETLGALFPGKRCGIVACARPVWCSLWVQQKRS